MSIVRTGKDRESYTEGLDHILSNTEFETSQQEQQIQNELDKIKAHEKEIEEKEKEIEDFVRVAADMESRKEKALKQLLLNRDNITSLKHTVAVLNEHLEALGKKYETMVQKTVDTSLQYNSAVEKYAEKWERFQSTYNDMPKARELTGKQETLKEIKGKEAGLDAKIADVEKALGATKPEGWDATVQWVLQIATVRVETEAIRRLISSTGLASRQAQQELRGSKGIGGTSVGKQGRDDQMVVETEGEREGEEKGEEGETGVSKPGNITGMVDTHVEPMDVGSDLAPADHDQTLDTSPPQQVPSANTRSNTIPHEKPNKGAGEGRGPKEANEQIGQRKGLGDFVRPNAPPSRFTPPNKQQPASASSSVNTLTQTPSLVYTKPSIPMKSTERTPSILPPYRLQSPRPPVPPSPRPQASPSLPPTTRPTTRSIPKLPQFSFRLPTSGGTSTSVSPGLPDTTGRLQPTTARKGGDKTPNADKDPTLTPPPSVNRASTATSVSAGPRSQYRLTMPPKPTPPSVRPPPTTISGNSTPLPMKTFSLPNQPNKPIQSKQPVHLVGTTSQQSHSKQSVQPTNPTKKSISRPLAIDKGFPAVLTAPNPQVGRCLDLQEPQKSYEAPGQTSNGGGQNYHPEEEAQRIPVQLEDMELGEGEQMGGEGEEEMGAGRESTFNLTTTSINFGEEQSVDFEGSGDQLQIFGVQQYDPNALNVSQTEGFFSNNESQSGESYGFMTLNDGGDQSSSQGDFFSQFGKATTPSGGEGGGFLF